MIKEKFKILIFFLQSLNRTQFDAGPYASNSVSYCKAGATLAVATDEGMIKLYSESTGKLEHLLKGHEDAVQDVKFDYNSK